MNNLLEILRNLKLEDLWFRFLADLRQAITAPTADPRVTLMVTFILLIFVSILVLIGLIIYTFTTGGRRAIIVTKVQVSEKDRLINNLLMLVFVLVLVFTANYYAERQSSCLGCHTRSTEYAALKKTAHKDVQCISCHKAAGATGYLRQKVDFLRMLFVFYSKGGKDNNPAMQAKGGSFDSACLRCHGDILKRNVRKENLVMSHKEKVGTEFSCADCHNQVAHPGISKPVKQYDMFDCSVCHKEVHASNRCGTCHPQYAMGVILAKDVELPKTELPEVLNCYGPCHDEKKECLPCHGVTMPHPEDWVGEVPQHARYAAFTRKKLCWRCHYDGDKYFSPGREFCGKCHPLEFHGPDEEVYWSHQRFYPGNCEMLCHGPGFCSTFCHEARTPRSPLPKRVEEAYFGYPPDVRF